MAGRMQAALRTLAAALALSLGLVPAPGAARDITQSVIVASKSDTEGMLLGNIIGLLLERAGVPVEYRLAYGPTKRVREALLADEIDIYPEYTGNAGYFHHVADDPVWKNPASALAKARELDASKQIVWLTPAPANNGWAIAVRREIVGANKTPTLEDFSRWIAGGGKVRLAASAEFISSPAALPALEKAYGFSLAKSQVFIVSSGNTADTIRAAANGKYGINAAMVYGTDGAIASGGLTVLRDTKEVQPVYQPAPVVRAELLEQYPSIPRLLTAAFETLTIETLQAINAQIQVDGQDPRAVATNYLRSRRLLPVARSRQASPAGTRPAAADSAPAKP
ncbi:MAG TPA: glycine betaine ABC transporter substrate-binding protein [Xanthobacteraceae bacterium]|nr:glycine betaine ABC transporter substrate-binding protein [Xanthobacteraceae bacterium]